jgi:oxaloacetate decarboxylase (Na+ extruding) subunit alpha
VTAVRIVDTTLRDGQLSLWACRMSVDDMAPAAADLDAAGLEAMEFFVASAQFARMVKELREDPWEWLRVGASSFGVTPRRLHGSLHSAFASTPRCVQDLLLDRLVELGIRTTRASDPWNDPNGLERTIVRMQSKGIGTVANIIYSVSPRHTAAYYADRTERIAALRPERLCFKDPGGLLTPETARELIPIVLDKAGGIPIELHVHTTNGLAHYVCLEGVELGIDIVHGAIPPLAEGSSLPSIFTLTDNLRARGHDVDVDTERLGRVSEHLTHVARVRSLPIGQPQVYDQTYYEHQIPGGMISNLEFQLSQLGMHDRLGHVLTEITRVRAELGYPIMVTPLSQFVGSQAVMNLVSGDRYATVSDEIIEYALGRWGAEAPEAMDEAVKARILDRPRTSEIEQALIEEPDLQEVRARYSAAADDDELITRAFAGIGNEPLPWTGARRVPRTYDEYRQAADLPRRLLRRLTESPEVRQFALKLPESGLELAGSRP